MASTMTNPSGKSHLPLNLIVASLIIGNNYAKEINVTNSFKDILTGKSSFSQAALQIVHSIVNGYVCDFAS